LYTQTINVLKKSPEHLEINLWDLPRFFRWPYTVCFCNHTWSQVILTCKIVQNSRWNITKVVYNIWRKCNLICKHCHSSQWQSAGTGSPDGGCHLADWALNYRNMSCDWSHDKWQWTGK